MHAFRRVHADHGGSLLRWLIIGCVAILGWDGSSAVAAGTGDWLQWRGPTGDNHAADGANPPLQWNLQLGTNVVWKTAIPGRGHSSPTIVDDLIYLTTADEQAKRQSLLVFNRRTGESHRQVAIHDRGLPEQIHPKNTHASPTVASDGEHQYVVFYNDGAIRVTVIDRLGRVVWRQNVCAFRPATFQFGYGASPIIEGNLLIIAAEYDGPDSGLYALDKQTGRLVWKVPRPSNLSFSSPIVTHIAGRGQLLLAGANTIKAFDPPTGRQLWSADASTEAICGTVCWDHRTVFISGGNPVAGTWAVLADGSEKLLWENSTMCYEQSLLAANGYVYAISDRGVASCWKATDGTEMWKHQLGGSYSASPLLVDDRIYIASESGEIFVIKATPARFELLAKNRLGDEIFATPVAVGDRLYVRYATNEAGRRQEYLIALGR